MKKSTPLLCIATLLMVACQESTESVTTPVPVPNRDGSSYQNPVYTDDKDSGVHQNTTDSAARYMDSSKRKKRD